MKIYFAGSICGGRYDTQLYRRIIDFLKAYGEVLTEHIGYKSLTELGDDAESSFIYKRDIQWLSSADIVIAEVTTPSLGVGFEIARAIQLNKPVLCLYRPRRGRRLSAMIAGCPDIHNAIYTSLEEAKKEIDMFLKNEDDSAVT